MGDESSRHARLIPTSGINGAEEQERRATSALLAVMSAVREFGRVLTKRFGAPAGTVEAFIEMPFLVGGKKLIPDGVIRVSRGGKTWTALVEVKTGTNQLAAEQLENYLDIAREEGFDAVLTVSNEIPPVAGQHPTKVDRRKLKKVDLHHLSWTKILTEAVMQKEVRGVHDPDQAWILGELIRYLEHPRSGAMEFEDMGDSWVRVRDAVRAGTLMATDDETPAVAARFDALLRYASLRLGRRLGAEVTPVLSRRDHDEPDLRTQALVASLCESGKLTGAMRIPDTVGHLMVDVDVRAGQIVCHVALDAPREGRPRTRVNWLLRQLKNAPDELRIESFVARGRGASAAELLRDVRVDSTLLIPDKSKELRSFRLALVSAMGAKRGRGRGAFIDSVLTATDTFYTEVLQNLKLWSPVPPRVRRDDVDQAENGQKVDPSLTSTALSSQDDSSGDMRVLAPGSAGQNS